MVHPHLRSIQRSGARSSTTGTKLRTLLRSVIPLAIVFAVVQFFPVSSSTSSTSWLLNQDTILALTTTSSEEGIQKTNDTDTTTDTSSSSSSSSSFDVAYPLVKDLVHWPAETIDERLQALPPNLEYKCDMVTFRASNGQTTQMCVHRFSDLISRHIRQHGYWEECRLLTKVWNRMNPPNGSIFLDAGANIGSCTMEMLLATNAQIVAVEPNPYNYYCLARSLQQMKASLKNRVQALPVAMGSDGPLQQTLHASANNFGNSIVGQEIRDYASERFHPIVFDIPVDRLDKILHLDSSSSIRIALTKMDVQGFECHALEGMGNGLLNQSDAFHFEYSRDHLGKQNCTNLYARFRRAGFDLFRLLGRGGGAVYLPHQSPNLKMANFIAYKRDLEDTKKLFQKKELYTPLSDGENHPAPEQATVHKVTINNKK